MNIMAAATKSTIGLGNKMSSLAEDGKEEVRTILEALHRCAEKLQQPEDAVSFTINSERIQRLPDMGPAVLCSILQQHISSLQPILAHLQAFVTEEGERICLKDSEAVCHTVAVEKSTNADPENVVVTHEENKVQLSTCCVTDSAMVQIQAGKSEIDRRIWAFIEKKQAEINESNIREFCNVLDCNQENSCARTDAVFTQFPGFKSHIKVSRVVNACGPQTRKSASSSSTKVHSLQRNCGNQAVEERLQNIECHVQLLPDDEVSNCSRSWEKKLGRSVPKDIYQRIKKLEDKILELEGISPEYFQSLNVSSKRKKVHPSQKYSLVELDRKINGLRQSLLQK